LLRGFQFVPYQRTLGLFARQAGFAEAVFDGVEGNLHFVAELDFELTRFVAELLDRHNALGFESCVDDDNVVADLDYDARYDRSGLQFGQRLALFEQFGKTLSKTISHVGSKLSQDQALSF
jgi:hypothetical protein